MRAIGELRVIQMTSFVPAWHLEAAALYEEEIHGALRRLLQHHTASNQQRRRFALRRTQLRLGAKPARAFPGGKIRAPKIPSPIILSATINPTRTRHLSLPHGLARRRQKGEDQRLATWREKICRDHSAFRSVLFVTDLIDEDAHALVTWH